MKAKLFIIPAVAAILLSSCQKEDFTPATSQEEAVEAAPEIVGTPGKLISATKTGSVSAAQYVEKLVGSEQSEDKTMEVFRMQLLGMDLLSLDIVTYRIHYWSTTVVNGEQKSIKLAGDVSYLVDNTGLVKTRHLESVSMIHTIFNTSSHDTETLEYFKINLRAIYNALVVYPFYQGGPDTVFVGEDGNEGTINVLTSEYIIKAKQAIDCELAALEFIEQQEGVKMMSGYYTENMGFSNGGGPALAFQYLLENDSEYSEYADQINLHSTYVGAGNCSNSSIVNNIGKIDETIEFLAGVAPAAYITMIGGTYTTWGDKYFSGIDLNYYFSETLFRMCPDENNNYEWYDTGAYCEYNPLKLYLTNQIPLLYYSTGLSLSTTMSSNIFDEDRQLIENDATDALLEAFKENDKIDSGWIPEAGIRFVHSDSDDFLPYETNYNIWKDLSNDGEEYNVLFETQTGLSHYDSFAQCIADVLLNKHPYSGSIRVDADYIIALLGISM